MKSKSPLFYKRKRSIARRTGKKNPRVPRKNSRENIKHSSDLFTDENPKGTVHGMKFVNPTEARKSITKLKKLYKNKKISFAHMRQIGVTMEQRSRFHSHPTKNIKDANKLWKKFNKSFKKSKNSRNRKQSKVSRKKFSNRRKSKNRKRSY
jgi:hypothetical protein